MKKFIVRFNGWPVKFMEQSRCRLAFRIVTDGKGITEFDSVAQARAEVVRYKIRPPGLVEVIEL